LHLVRILFPHINDDGRSKSHQIRVCGSGVFIGVEVDGEAVSRLRGTMYVDVETLVEIIRLVEIIVSYIFTHVQSDTQTHTYITLIHKSIVEKAGFGTSHKYAKYTNIQYKILQVFYNNSKINHRYTNILLIE